MLESWCVMLLRRLFVGAPLAVVVAVVAHVAGFGFAHAPGTTHALDLAFALGSALAALAGGVILRGFARGRAFRLPGASQPLARSRHANLASVAQLTAFAALAFIAIEALEGNLAHVGSLHALVALVALVPIAMVVGWLAPRAGATLCELGSSLRASLGTRGRDPLALALARRSTRVFAASQFAFARRRGRAPPLRA